MDEMLKVLGWAILTCGLLVGVVHCAAKQQPGYGKPHQLRCTIDGKETFRSELTHKYIGTMERVPGWHTGHGAYYPRGGELCKVYYVN